MPQRTYERSGPQNIAQNEIDLREAPLLQELGIDGKMIIRKLKMSFPMASAPEEVAMYPEMVFGGVVLLSLLLLALMSRAALIR